MKITFCFGDTKVVVPCGSGSFCVRNLAEKAVIRFKNISTKVSQKDRIVLYNLKTAEDGGILDWDDLVKDVLDDKDMVIASYRLHTFDSRDSETDQDQNSPSENYLNPLKIHLPDVGVKRSEDKSYSSVNKSISDDLDNNPNGQISVDVPGVASPFKDTFQDVKNKNFDSLTEELEKRRQLIRDNFDEYEYEDAHRSLSQITSDDEQLQFESPRGGSMSVVKTSELENTPNNQLEEDVFQNTDDEAFTLASEDESDDKEDINNEGLQTVRRAMIAKLENDKNRGLILPPPPKDLEYDIQSVESSTSLSCKKENLKVVEVDDDEVPPNAPIRASSLPKLESFEDVTNGPCVEEKQSPPTQLVVAMVEEAPEPIFDLVVSGYDHDDIPLVAVPSTIAEEDEEDGTTEYNEEDSRVTQLAVSKTSSRKCDSISQELIDEDYPMLRRDYTIKQNQDSEKVLENYWPNYAATKIVPNPKNVPGVNPSILKWLENNRIGENGQQELSNEPSSPNLDNASTLKESCGDSESLDDRLSSVTSRYNREKDRFQTESNLCENYVLVKIDNKNCRGENLGMQIKPIVSSKDKSATKSSNNGIQVHSITPNGRMDREKTISVGDQILFINNQDLRSLPFEKCRALFQESLKQDSVEMYIIPAKRAGKESPKHIDDQDSVSEKSNSLKKASNLKTIPPPPPRRSPNTSLTNKGSETDELNNNDNAIPPPSFSPPPLPKPNPLVVAEKLQMVNNISNGKQKKTILQENEKIPHVEDQKLKDFSLKPPDVIKISNDSLSIIRISLKKGINGLGFSLTSKDSHKNDGRTCGPVYVKNILPGGSAITNGLLKQGDRLLKVDGVDVTQAGQAKVVTLLREKPINSVVNFTIARNTSLSAQYSQSSGSCPSSSISISNFDDSRKASLASSSQDIHSRILSKVSNFGMGNANVTELEISLKGYQNKPVSKTGSMPSQQPITLGISITIRSSQPNIEADTSENVKNNAVYIRKLIEGGAAHRDGRLRVGDRLLAIDNQALSGLSANDALYTLKTEISKDLAMEQPSCRLVISRSHSTSTLNHPRNLHQNSDSEQGPDGENDKKDDTTKRQAKKSTERKGHSQSEDKLTPQNSKKKYNRDNEEKPEIPKRNHKNLTKNQPNPAEYFITKPSAFSLAGKQTAHADANTGHTAKAEIVVEEKPIEAPDKSLEPSPDETCPDEAKVEKVAEPDPLDVSSIIPMCQMTNFPSNESHQECKKSVDEIINSSFDGELLTGWTDHPSYVETGKEDCLAKEQLKPQSINNSKSQIYRCDSQGTIYSSDLTDKELDEDDMSTRNVKRNLEMRSKSAADRLFETHEQLLEKFPDLVAIPLNSSYWKRSNQEISSPTAYAKKELLDDQNADKENEDLSQSSKLVIEKTKAVPMNQSVENKTPVREADTCRSRSHQPLDCLSNISDSSKRSFIMSKVIKFVKNPHSFRRRSSSQSLIETSTKNQRANISWTTNPVTSAAQRIMVDRNRNNLSVASNPVKRNSAQSPAPMVGPRVVESKSPMDQCKSKSVTSLRNQSLNHHSHGTQSGRMSMFLRCCDDEDDLPQVIHRKELSTERPKSQNSFLHCSGTLTEKSTREDCGLSQDTLTIDMLYSKLKKMKDPDLIVNSSNSALVQTHIPEVQAYRHHDFLQNTHKSISPTASPVPVFSPAPCCKKQSSETSAKSLPSPPQVPVQKRVNFSTEDQVKHVSLASPESSLSTRSTSSEKSFAIYEKRPLSGYVMPSQNVFESNYSEVTSRSGTLTKSSVQRPLRVPYEYQPINVNTRSPQEPQYVLINTISPNSHYNMGSLKKKKTETKPIFEDAEQLYTKIKNKIIKPSNQYPNQRIIQSPNNNNNQLPPHNAQLINNVFPQPMSIMNNRIVKNIYVTQSSHQPRYIDPSLLALNGNMASPNNGTNRITLRSLSSPRAMSSQHHALSLNGSDEPIYAKVNKVYILPTT